MASGTFVTFELGAVNVYDDYEARLLADKSGVPAEMDRIATRIKELAQRLAPRRTGVLRESAESGRDGNDWYVRFYAHYALYVEMGHRIVFHHKTVGYQPPHPYLRPAMDIVVSETNA